MATVKSEKRVATYHGIENLFTPDVFFNLMGWTDRECHTERVRYSISDFHYAAGERLSSVLGTEKFGNITRAVMGLGMMALAKFYNIAEKQIDKIIKESNGKGYELLKKEIEYICSCKNIHTDKLKDELIKIVDVYGDNKYNNILCTMLQTSIKNSENKKTVKINVSQFKSICEKELNDNMYKLKRSGDNCGVGTYTSKIIVHIGNWIKQEYRTNDTKSEICRGAHIAGLYIVSKWITNNTLSKYHEYYSASLLFDIKNVVYQA